MSTHIKHIFLAAAATCFIGAAQASEVIINEIEPNHPIDSAQMLTIPSSGSISIRGYIGNGIANDLDFFAFYANAGDVMTFDIQDGTGGVKNVDTVLGLFDGEGDYQLLRSNDDRSTYDYDALIKDFVAPHTGKFIIGVSNSPRYFVSGGTVTNSTRFFEGDYTLVISGVTPTQVEASEPEPIQVALVVRPGNNNIAPINPNNRGVTPVAILGGPDFSPLSIDTDTLTFGSTGEEKSLRKCNVTGADLNNDGRVDLICHFDNQAANFKPSDMEGKLKGKTRDGMKFEGAGYLKVLPAKANPNASANGRRAK